MNLQKLKQNLSEGQLTILFDILFMYHEYGELYSTQKMEDIKNVLPNYFPEIDIETVMSDLINIQILEKVDGMENSYIITKELRGEKFYKDLCREYEI